MWCFLLSKTPKYRFVCCSVSVDPNASQQDHTFRGFVPGMVAFERFTLRRILGRGGMGVVWAARDDRLSQEVALKFLPEALVWDAVARQQLTEETRRTRCLTHPNIVRIHDLFEDERGAAICMELVEGKDMNRLKSEHASGVLEPADIEVWLAQLIDALDYAHREQGIVHRDLKPSNILLTVEGRIKVSDFGVACSIAETMTRVSSYGGSGTLAYMSPQQYDGDPPTPADDWYALGATLYDLLTGKPPFFRGAVADQIRNRRPERLSVRRQQLQVAELAPVPREWEEVVLALLAKDPADRSRGREALGALIGAGAGAVPVATWGTSPPGPTARTWRRVAWMGLLLGALGPLVWYGRDLSGLVASSDPAGRDPVHSASASAGTDGRSVANSVLPDAADPDLELRLLLPLALNVQDAGPLALGTRETGVRFDRVPLPNGAIGPAAMFDGRNWVEVVAAEALPLNPDGGFEWSLMLRPGPAPVDADQVIVGNAELRAGDTQFTIYRNGNDVRVVVDDVDAVAAGSRIGVRAREVLRPNEWNHVTVRYAGGRLRLAVDEVWRGEARGTLQSRRSDSLVWRLGRGSEGSLGYVGAIRDVRLSYWRSGAEVNGRSVASETSPPNPAGLPFALSATLAHPTEPLETLIRREFGADASLADWNDLKSWIESQPNPEAAIAQLGLEPSQSAFVRRGEQRIFAGERQYFATRFSGLVPEYYLAHDTAAKQQLALGSWMDVSLHILAAAPPGRVLLPVEENVELKTADTGAYWRWCGDIKGRLTPGNGGMLIAAGPTPLRLERPLEGASNVASLVLFCRLNLSSLQWGNRVELYFEHKGLRTLHLIVESADDARSGLRVVLTDGNLPPRRSVLPAYGGSLDLVLMLRGNTLRGSIRRAVDDVEIYSETVESVVPAQEPLVQTGIIFTHRGSDPFRLEAVRLRAEGGG